MRFVKKTVPALVLALAVVLSLGIGIGYAEKSAPTYTDVPETYWGYEAITTWSTKEYGILQGYGNEKFGPNDPITAEQLAWINGRICGVADTDAKYEGNGKRQLTRAEAVAIIAQAFCIEPLEYTSNTFADNANIPAMYRGYVNAMKAAGYIQGMGNNTFGPNSTYTRAHALQVIYNMISDITDKNASNVNAADSYVIRKAGVQLKDSTINGNLIVGHGVGDGEVTLENVTVNGKLIVFGGGSNSIIVRGKSSIANIDVYKTTGQPVRIKVEGEAVVKTVTVANDGKVIVNGAITTLIADDNTSVELQKAQVANISVTGSSVTMNVDGGSAVKTVAVSASNVKLTGSGKVEAVTVAEGAKSGVVVDTKGTKVSVAQGAGDVTDSSGKVIVKSGETKTTAGTSTTYPSGGGSTSRPTPSGSGSGRAS